MRITIIGTGFIGRTLGANLASSGHEVTFGSRHPAQDHGEQSGPRTVSIAESLADADSVILALPGGAVRELAEECADELSGKLVIDATNQMGAPIANARASLPADVRYARAFNTLGG